MLNDQQDDKATQDHTECYSIKSGFLELQVEQRSRSWLFIITGENVWACTIAIVTTAHAFFWWWPCSLWFCPNCPSEFCSYYKNDASHHIYMIHGVLIGQYCLLSCKCQWCEYLGIGHCHCNYCPCIFLMMGMQSFLMPNIAPVGFVLDEYGVIIGQ